MDGELRSDAFKELGYERTDWIPVFQPFENHPDLADNGVPATLAEAPDVGDYPRYLREGEAVYSVKDGPGDLALWFNPRKRDEEGLMAWGDVIFSGPIQGEPITEKYNELAEQVSAPYLDPNPANGCLNSITIPEDYTTESIQNTVNEAVTLVRRAQRFQADLEETVTDYEI